MLKLFQLSAPALVALLAASSSWSADLSLLRTFPHSGPSGLSYDDRYCGIWVANETRLVTLITPWGEEIMSFESQLNRVDAIAITGNDLILSDGNGLYQRVDRMGTILGDPYRLSGKLRDTDGLFVDVATHDHWVADDSLAQLIRVSADGTIRQTLDGATQSPQLMEPQGITIDPISGNLLVTDDADASDSLFEFSADGQLLDVISLALGGYDAEGITIQPETRTVFVAYDDGDMIAAFQYEPTFAGTIATQVSQQISGCVISALPVTTEIDTAKG